MPPSKNKKCDAKNKSETTIKAAKLIFVLDNIEQTYKMSAIPTNICDAMYI